MTRRPTMLPTASREGDPVTTMELFFDLVFVFAFTQVTALMAHGTPPSSILGALVVLSLLWWSWCSFAWLANHARANRGVTLATFAAAMVGMFVASLAIPEAYHDGRAACPARSCWSSATARCASPTCSGTGSPPAVTPDFDAPCGSPC